MKAKESMLIRAFATVAMVAAFCLSAFAGMSASDVMKALEGKAAGVQILSSGAPEAEMTIRIRGVGTVTGNSQPLYIIDGMPMTGGIADLNPSDIESIQVLKDAASTAIYGSRGANGVILITTKRTGAVQTNVVTVTAEAQAKIAALNGVIATNGVPVTLDQDGKLVVERGTRVTLSYTVPEGKFAEYSSGLLVESIALSGSLNFCVGQAILDDWGYLPDDLTYEADNVPTLYTVDEARAKAVKEFRLLAACPMADALRTEVNGFADNLANATADEHFIALALCDLAAEKPSTLNQRYNEFHEKARADWGKWEIVVADGTATNVYDNLEKAGKALQEGDTLRPLLPGQEGSLAAAPEWMNRGNLCDTIPVWSTTAPSLQLPKNSTLDLRGRVFYREISSTRDRSAPEDNGYLLTIGGANVTVRNGYFFGLLHPNEVNSSGSSSSKSISKPAKALQLNEYATATISNCVIFAAGTEASINGKDDNALTVIDSWLDCYGDANEAAYFFFWGSVDFRNVKGFWNPDNFWKVDAATNPAATNTMEALTGEQFAFVYTSYAPTNLYTFTDTRIEMHPTVHAESVPPPVVFSTDGNPITLKLNGSAAIVAQDGDGCILPAVGLAKQGGINPEFPPENPFLLVQTNGVPVNVFEANTEIAAFEGEDQLIKADAYGVISSGNGYYWLKLYEAQIGETKYFSFTNAVAQAQAGDTITVLSNVGNPDDPMVVTIDKPLFLDSTNDDSKIYCASNVVVSGGALTVKNGSFYDNATFTTNGTGTVEIWNATFVESPEPADEFVAPFAKKTGSATFWEITSPWGSIYNRWKAMAGSETEAIFAYTNGNLKLTVEGKGELRELGQPEKDGLQNAISVVTIEEGVTNVTDSAFLWLKYKDGPCVLVLPESWTNYPAGFEGQNVKFGGSEFVLATNVTVQVPSAMNLHYKMAFYDVTDDRTVDQDDTPMTGGNLYTVRIGDFATLKFTADEGYVFQQGDALAFTTTAEIPLGRVWENTVVSATQLPTAISVETAKGIVAAAFQGLLDDRPLTDARRYEITTNMEAIAALPAADFIAAGSFAAAYDNELTGSTADLQKWEVISADGSTTNVCEDYNSVNLTDGCTLRPLVAGAENLNEPPTWMSPTNLCAIRLLNFSVWVDDLTLDLRGRVVMPPPTNQDNGSLFNIISNEGNVSVRNGYLFGQTYREDATPRNSDAGVLAVIGCDSLVISNCVMYGAGMMPNLLVGNTNLVVDSFFDTMGDSTFADALFLDGMEMTLRNVKGFWNPNNFWGIDPAKDPEAVTTLEAITGDPILLSTDINLTLDNTKLETRPTVNNGEVYPPLFMYGIVPQTNRLTLVNGASVKSFDADGAALPCIALTAGRTLHVEGAALEAGADVVTCKLREVPDSGKALEAVGFDYGVKVVTDGDGWFWTVPQEAMIDDVQYATLAEAVEAAKDGDTVRIVGDVTLTNTLVIAKKITFKAEPECIVSPEEGRGEFVEIHVVEGGELTILSGAYETTLRTYGGKIEAWSGYFTSDMKPWLGPVSEQEKGGTCAGVPFNYTVTIAAGTVWNPLLIGSPYKEDIIAYITTGDTDRDLGIFSEGNKSIEDYIRTGGTFKLVIDGKGEFGEFNFSKFQELVSSVEMSEGITEIAKEMFKDFTLLTEFTVPASVKTIGKQAIANCSKLTNVIWAADAQIEGIAEMAFRNAPIRSLTIPASIKQIGPAILGDKPKAREIHFEGQPEGINEEAFVGISGQWLFLPEGWEDKPAEWDNNASWFGKPCSWKGGTFYVEVGEYFKVVLPEVDGARFAVSNATTGVDLTETGWLNGWIDGTADQVWRIKKGSKIIIDATPYEGYKFEDSAFPIVIDAIDADYTPTAEEFPQTERTDVYRKVMISTNGVPEGVEVSGAGIYAVGETVTLSVKAPKGLTFGYWMVIPPNMLGAELVSLPGILPLGAAGVGYLRPIDPYEAHLQGTVTGGQTKPGILVDCLQPDYRQATVTFTLPNQKSDIMLRPVFLSAETDFLSESRQPAVADSSAIADQQPISYLIAGKSVEDSLRYMFELQNGKPIDGEEGHREYEEEVALMLQAATKVQIVSGTFPTVSVTGLPKGLKFDKKTLRFSGTPTEPGFYNVTISAKTVFGLTASKVVRIFVDNFRNDVVVSTIAREFNAKGYAAADDVIGRADLAAEFRKLAAAPSEDEEEDEAPVSAYRLTVGDGLGIELQPIGNTNTLSVVKIAAKKLPSGLKFDKKTWKLTGSIKKAGSFPAIFSVTLSTGKTVLASLLFNVDEQGFGYNIADFDDLHNLEGMSYIDWLVDEGVLRDDYVPESGVFMTFLEMMPELELGDTLAGFDEDEPVLVFKAADVKASSFKATGLPAGIKLKSVKDKATGNVSYFLTGRATKVGVFNAKFVITYGGETMIFNRTYVVNGGASGYLKVQEARLAETAKEFEDFYDSRMEIAYLPTNGLLKITGGGSFTPVSKIKLSAKPIDAKEWMFGFWNRNRLDIDDWQECFDATVEIPAAEAAEYARNGGLTAVAARLAEDELTVSQSDIQMNIAEASQVYFSFTSVSKPEIAGGKLPAGFEMDWASAGQVLSYDGMPVFLWDCAVKVSDLALVAPGSNTVEFVAKNASGAKVPFTVTTIVPEGQTKIKSFNLWPDLGTIELSTGEELPADDEAAYRLWVSEYVGGFGEVVVTTEPALPDGLYLEELYPGEWKLLGSATAEFDGIVSFTVTSATGLFTSADPLKVRIIVDSALVNVDTWVAEGKGTITGDNGSYLAGDLASFTAVPAEGYQFSHWEGDVRGPDNKSNIADLGIDIQSPSITLLLPAWAESMNLRATFVKGAEAKKIEIATTGIGNGKPALQDSGVAMQYLYDPANGACCGVTPAPENGFNGEGDELVVSVGAKISFTAAIAGTDKAKTTVKGLPSGLKFAKKDLTDKTFGAVAAGTVYGIPTKAGDFTVTLTAPNAQGVKQTQAFKVRVIPMADWAVGDFEGFLNLGAIDLFALMRDGKNTPYWLNRLTGQDNGPQMVSTVGAALRGVLAMDDAKFTLKVAKNGKMTGSAKIFGKTAKLSVAGFDRANVVTRRHIPGSYSVVCLSGAAKEYSARYNPSPVTQPLTGDTIFDFCFPVCKSLEPTGNPIQVVEWVNKVRTALGWDQSPSYYNGFIEENAEHIKAADRLYPELYPQWKAADDLRRAAEAAGDWDEYWIQYGIMESINERFRTEVGELVVDLSNWPECRAKAEEIMSKDEKIGEFAGGMLYYFWGEKDYEPCEPYVDTYTVRATITLDGKTFSAPITLTDLNRKPREIIDEGTRAGLFDREKFERQSLVPTNNILDAVKYWTEGSSVGVAVVAPLALVNGRGYDPADDLANKWFIELADNVGAAGGNVIEGIMGGVKMMLEDPNVLDYYSELRSSAFGFAIQKRFGTQYKLPDSVITAQSKMISDFFALGDGVVGVLNEVLGAQFADQLLGGHELLAGMDLPIRYDSLKTELTFGKLTNKGAMDLTVTLFYDGKTIKIPFKGTLLPVVTLSDDDPLTEKLMKLKPVRDYSLDGLRGTIFVANLTADLKQDIEVNGITLLKKNKTLFLPLPFLSVQDGGLDVTLTDELIRVLGGMFVK